MSLFAVKTYKSRQAFVERVTKRSSAFPKLGGDNGTIIPLLPLPVLLALALSVPSQYQTWRLFMQGLSVHGHPFRSQLKRFLSGHVSPVTFIGGA